MEGKPTSLYARLGGYDAIAAVVDDLLPRLRSDALLSRFWTSPRSLDTLNRERQLAVDFIASAAGGPTIYLGRDMKMSHKGMGITKADYEAFMRCLSVTLDTFKVPDQSAAKSWPLPPAWNRKSWRHSCCFRQPTRLGEARSARQKRPQVKGR